MEIKKIIFSRLPKINIETVLLFAEYGWQVDDLRKLSIVEKCQWIATGPCAMHRLFKLEIDYRTPDDYCGDKEVEEICVAQFNKLVGVCDELDKVMFDEYPAIKEWGIRPFFFHLWQLGALSDVLLSRAAQINRIIDSFPNSVAYIHVAKLADWQPEDLLFKKDDTIWGHLLVNKGIDSGGRVETLPVKSLYNLHRDESNYSISIADRIKQIASGFIKNDINLYSLYKNYRCGILKNKNKANILVIHENEWKHIFKRLANLGYHLYFLPSIFNERFNKRKCISGSSEKLWPIFINSFDLVYRKQIEIMKDRFNYIAEEPWRISLEVMARFKKILRNKRIKIILNACGLDYTSYLICQYAKKNKIKCFSYQHGALWYENRINQRIDLLDLVGYDYLMAFGDGPKAAYETSSYIHQENCKIIPVGMPSLDNLNNIIAKKNKNNKIIEILWPFGGYYGNNWYCGFSPCKNDRIYYKNQVVILKGLLDLINKNRNLSLTVKLYPNNYSYQPPWVSDIRNFEQIKVVYDRPGFTDLLIEHDLVIIDSPTTTLLQAIATALPVFVLTSVISPPRKDLKTLEKRAVCAVSADNLINKITDYIETGKYAADIYNREFLKRYGTYLDDGGAGERAGEIISSVLEKK